MDIPQTRERPEPVPVPDFVLAAPPLPEGPLQTPRLLLRPWREEEIAAVCAICQDPDVQRWTTVPSPYQLKDAEWFVREHAPKGFRSGDEATFGVFVKETGQIAGAVGLAGITTLVVNRGVRTAEVGYWANPETRGNGYITEAVREVVRWAFEDVKLGRVVWQAFDGNEASRRVIEKVGFTIVGRQRASHAHRGVPKDMWLADILPGELRWSATLR
ncbi:GCN5-related N-acetyltransferase [Catenulispora acidiphila DSM 44928]|uniref:GCN5-related N-acetyltransferase n=1 Tax=Catenulispora acidiphila (strain DSM 44928 / JCM 14897 / NBRC 102108 / NRRL B-24433 / ID139908) TaxID=479433 RepID=C7QBB9_CATAD|nr:GNAT family N-acetyltransferase [Catenulispora acidiphila]ACU76410.1 GCN5-related N-acetyltransferase [Catenulispora acidiphila DSM 44928]